MWIMDFANDDDFSMGWNSNPTVAEPWYEVSLGKSSSFNMIVIAEEQSNIRKYKLEYFTEGVWKTLSEGENTSKIKIHRFDRVQGEKVRMKIESSKTNPSIMEFGVYDERR